MKGAIQFVEDMLGASRLEVNDKAKKKSSDEGDQVNEYWGI